MQSDALLRNALVGSTTAIAPAPLEINLSPALNEISRSSSIAFVDRGIQGYEQLIANAASGIDFYVLDPVKDAVSQITDILLERKNVSAVHILSHGSSGGLALGKSWLDSNALERYADQFQSWSKALTQDADILLYGCDVAADEAGEAFVKILSQLTQADVAASTDLTGSANLGGDWTLEYNQGKIEAGLAIQSAALANYQSVFGISFTGTAIANAGINTASAIARVTGNAILNVLGDITIDANGITGDGTGGADNLTLTATGKVDIRGLVGTGGLDNLTINAKEIIVADNVRIEALSDVTFAAKDLRITIESLLPGVLPISADIKSAGITLGNNAVMQAENIDLSAEAKDINPTDGLNEFLDGIIVQPLLESFAGQLPSLPVSVMIRKSNANITIGNGSQILASGDVNIAATAEADATGEASGEFLSVGWSDATASATTNIGQNVVIQASGDVDITATAGAVANMTTETAPPEEGESQVPGVAASLAVARADITAKTTIAQGATITAGGNANILATGSVEREAGSGSEASQGGKAGVSLGLGFTKSDIQAIVNGEVTARTTKENVFSPASAINNNADTITLSNHGFKNGQAVVYSKGSGSDIDGLEDGSTYFVIVVNSNTIKLAESAKAVEENEAIDLSNAGVQGTDHVLKDPGIRVVAQLETEDKASATSGVSDEEEETPDAKGADGASTSVDPSALIQGLTANNASQNAGAGGSGSKSNFSAAGAFAFSRVQNNVAATVGLTGILKSEADISVLATIENKNQTQAEASVEPNEGAQASTASAAVIVGLYSNSAIAKVDGTTDARKATTISSEVIYPFLSTVEENFDILGKLKEDGIAGLVEHFDDGTLGFKSSLFNSWAKSTAKAEKLGIAGSVNFQQFTSNAQAIVGSNAKINQTAAFQTNEQTVSVEAKTELHQINITGVFDFELTTEKLQELKDSKDRLADLNPAGSQSGKGGMGGSLFLLFNNSNTIAKVESGALIRTGADGDLTVNAESKNIDINVAQSGASGKQFGVGGTFVYTQQTSNTIAQVESGVKFQGGALNITAADETTRVNAVGGVAKGGNVGIGLSVSLNNMDRTVSAFIGQVATTTPITGTDIDAGDITIAAKGTGGLWSFSLAAAIASKNPQDQTDQNPPEQSTDVADSQGQSDDPLDGVTLPTLFGEMTPEESPGNQNNSAANTSNDKGNQGKSGIGISGDVSINTATDRVSAFINDAGTIKGEKVALEATNDTVMRVSSGSAAFAKSADPNATSVGIAGSVSVNTLTGTTNAFISGTATGGQKLALIASELSLKATRSGDLFALSASGSGAPGKNGIAIAGSVSVNRITNTTQAYLDGVQAAITGSVLLDAQDSTHIFAIGGAASLSGKAGFGAGVGVNIIKNAVKANSNNTTLDLGTSLTLSAVNGSEIQAIALSFGVSLAQNGIGGAGTISVNNITLTTEASIAQTNRTIAVPLPTGAIALTAKNTAEIRSLAGAVGGGSSVGFGAAVAYNGITNNTQASISQSNLATTAGTEISAESSGTIQSLTLGVGGGKDLGLGGSVAINVIRGGTRAFVDQNTVLLAGGQINLRAKDTSTIEGLSGGIAGSQKAAIGAAISVNDISTTTTSYIEKSVVTSQNAGVHSRAEASATIKTITVGGVVSGKVAIAGSVSVNLIRKTVDSHIADTATVTAAQDVKVEAIASSTLEANGGALAVAGKVSVAGSLAVNDVENRTIARIAGSTVTSSQGNVIVSADSRDTVRTISVGGSGAGKVGVAGSASVSMMGNNTTAEIVGSTVSADDNVLVLANSRNSIEFYGGTISIGGVAGVGGLANVNTIANTTQASIRQGANVTAKGNATSLIPKADGTKTINGNQLTELTRGIAVIATSEEQVDVVSVNLAGGGKAGVAATASVTVLESQTTASIDSASINANNTGANAGQTVKVKASNNSTVDIKAGSIAGSGAVGVGATVDVTVIGNTTRAFINNAPIVNAQAGVDVTSFTREKFGSVVASGAGGFFAGVAGSLLVSDIRSQNEAFIAGSTINTFGNLRVIADDQVEATGAAGAAGLAGKGVGFGATISVITIANSTTARITNSTTNASGLTEVKANSVESVTTGGASLAAALFGGVAGTSLVSSLTTRTIATIDGTSRVNQDQAYRTATQDVRVTAANSSTLTGGVASLGGGIVGFGASVMVSGIWNTTSASIGDNAIVSAGRNITVNAVSNKSVTTAVMAFAGGGVGVAGAVSVVNIGSGMSSDGTSSVSGTQSTTDDQLNKSHVDSGLGSTSYANRAKTRADSKTVGMRTVGFGSTAPVLNGTSAFIGVNAVVNAGTDVNVTATETITLNQGIGNIAVGAVGVGGSVAIANINGNTQAFLAAGSTVNAGNNINVNANFTNTLNSIAGAGQGGLVGLGAQVVIVNDNSSQLAAIRNGARINQANNVSVNARANRTNTSTMVNLQAGGYVAGAAIARLTGNGSTQALVGNDAQIGQVEGSTVGSLSISADANLTATATTRSLSVGIGSASANVAIVDFSPTISANIGAGADIKTLRNINVVSSGTANVSTDVAGVNAGGFAVGLSDARSQVSTTLTTNVGNGSVLDAGTNILLASRFNRDTNGQLISSKQVKASASSSAGALIGLTGSNAEAKMTTNVAAAVGSNATLKAGNNVLIQSLAGNVVDAYASGQALGIAAAGVTSARAEIDNTSTASTDANVQINAGQNITISAQSDNRVIRSEAIGGAGGLFAGASTSGTAIITDNTTASVGANTRITALSGTIKVESLVSNEARSRGSISTGGAVTSNRTDSTSNVTSQVRTTIGDGANLLSDRIQLHSKVTKLDVDADAYSKTIAVNSTTNAQSNVDTNVDTKVTNGIGASLNGQNRLEIISRQDGVDTDSKAKSEIAAGLTGSVFATAHNNMDLDADIDILSRSNLSGLDILLEAVSPQDRNAIYVLDPETVAKTVVNYVLTAVEEVVKVVSRIPIIGWFVKWVTRTVMRLVEQILNSETEAKRSGNFSSNNTINLAGDIYQGAPSRASLVINPDLSVLTQGNISAQIVGNEVVVSDVTTMPPGQILINSPFGTVTGDVVIHKNSVLESVDITNNSTKDLRINRIRTINNAVESPDLDIRADINTANVTTVTDVVGLPSITIQNNTASNVIFAGLIENSTGSLLVANQGGSILMGSNVQLENASADLNAAQGRIGDLTNRLNLRLFDETTNATLQANAGQSISLNLQLSSNALSTGITQLDGLDLNSITAGQDIDLTIRQSDIYQFDLDTFVLSRVAIDGIYNLKNLSSTQGSVKVDIAQGTANISKVQAQSGTVNLKTVGQLVDVNTIGADIIAQDAILQATAGIGSTSNAIDTAVSRLEANGSGGMWINNTGNLSIGGISPMIGLTITGDLSLTNAGSVTVTENVTASGNVQVTTTDTQNQGEDIEVVANTKVESTGANVSLLAGDNFTLNPTGTIAARTQILIKGDHGNADSIGSTIDIRGALQAPVIEITGDSNTDRVNLTNVSTGSPVAIRTLDGDDTINIGSNSTPTANANGTLNRINANLTIDGGTGSDQFKADDSGDTTANTGTLTSNQLLGLGMTGTINYAGVEAIEVALGSGADTFTVASTIAGTTTVNTNAGTDTVNVQSISGATTVNAGGDNDTINVGNASNTVNDIAATLTVQGHVGTDALNVIDSGDTTANTGNLTSTRVSGLGMTGTIDYDTVEALDITLGSGGDTFTIQSTHTGSTTLNSAAGADTISIQSNTGATTVNAGANDDTVAVSVTTPGSTVVVNGEAGNDSLNATTSTRGVVLNGGDGDDTLQGGSGNDLLGGGSGNDRIEGNAGNDEIYGDSTFPVQATDAAYSSFTFDANVMTAPAGSRPSPTQQASQGNDTISGGIGSDTVYGEGGNDNIVGGSFTMNIVDGTDYLFGGAGNDAIAGDNATIDINRSIAVFNDNNGAVDYIFGDTGTLKFAPTGEVTRAANASVAGDGNDTIAGQIGNDAIFGGASNDVLAGNLGDDLLIGDQGTIDFINSKVTNIETTEFGIGGSDTITGDEGNDIAIGGFGIDTISGNAGDDILLGDNGKASFTAGVVVNVETTAPSIGSNDIINGNDGSDIVLGGFGADVMTGETGEDVLVGDNGRVQFATGILTKVESIDPGQGGNDVIAGNAGNDIAIGGLGDDTISGDAGLDTLLGDNGSVVRADGTPQANDVYSTDPTFGGRDVITGGLDNDLIIGGSGNSDALDLGGDTLSGNEGDDIIIGDNADITRDSSDSTELVESLFPIQGGDDTINGNDGNDLILGGFANDTISGNAGSDIILGDHGKITLPNGVIARIETANPLNGGNDSIQGNENADIILGGSGDDTIAGGLANDVILGDHGVIVRADGSSQANDIYSTDAANGGKDTITAGLGDDIVLGGADADRISGDEGNDVIFGDHADITRNASDVIEKITSTFADQGGDDTLEGNDDDDVLLGGAANDAILGNSGKDIILGDNGSLDYSLDSNLSTLDLITTTQPTIGGNDNIQGNEDNDIVLAGAANDTVTGDAGDDVLIGDHAEVTLTNNQIEQVESIDPGIGGDDSVSGGDGIDLILGGFGQDILYGNAGNDRMLGDNGLFDFAYAGDTAVGADTNLSTLDVIKTTDPTLGGNDSIFGGAGEDQVIGGSGSDFVAGDDGVDPTVVLTREWTVAERGDFNGDGNVDILWRNQVRGDVAVWLMNGKDILDYAVILPSVPSNWSIAGVNDFNNDGKDDLLWRDRNSGDVAVWLMNGRSIQSSAITLSSVPLNWTIKGIADLNNDKRADLVWRDRNSGDVAVWLMNGTQIQSRGIALSSVPLSWEIEGVVDLNNDGNTDLVWRDRNTGDVAAWLMNGIQIQSSAIILARLPLSWKIAGFGDFNNDQKADIIWRGQDNNEVAIWLMNGLQTASTGILLAGVTSNWTIEGVSDLNNDGRSDIAWRNRTNGDAAVWLINGTQLAGAAVVLSAIPSSWEIEGVDDFNQDGKAELFWRNTVSGEAAIWMMNGLTLTESTLYREGSLQPTATPSDDLVMGDHAIVYQALQHDRNFVSIDTQATDGGGEDVLYGNQGDDILLGQQGNDTMYGGIGEDDMIGGHNVLGGADGNDVMDGEGNADVMLGDNGRITRRRVNNAWQRFVAPFATVIRDMTRFDDVDRISGNDTMRGGTGDDIIQGQRGDDIIDGGAGDDELYGQLGNDTIQGGEGQDTILGDAGIITRDSNPDGSARRNLNGSWHRDVILTDVGRVTGTFSSTPTAGQFQTPDLLLLSGSAGYQVEFLGDGNDVIDAGAGDDAVFGQRGNDMIQGGSGNDYIEGNAGNDQIDDSTGDDFIVGDDTSNLPPFNTELPIVTRGIHLIEQNANLVLDFFGTIVTPQLTLTPDPISGLLPALTLSPTLTRDHSLTPITGNLRTSSGATLQTLVAVIPDILNHLDLLAGNDRLNSGTGLDTVVGDNYTNTIPLRTGNAAIDQSLDTMVRSLYHLNYDLHGLELALTGTSGAQPRELTIGSDVIDAGSDRDLVMGDNAFFIGGLTINSPSNAAVLSSLLGELQQVISSFNSTVNFVLNPLVNRPMTQPITLAIGNDQITGNAGDDKLLADDTFIIAPNFKNPNYVKGSFWNYTVNGANRPARPTLREFNLKLGNDLVNGGTGNDLMIGGYSNVILPLANQAPTTQAERTQFQRDLELIAEDVRTFIRDLHNTNHGIDYVNNNQSHTLIAQNDVMNGEAGEDVMLGDNATLLLPIVNGQINLSFELVNGYLDSSDSSHNFSQGLLHQYDLIYRNPNLGVTQFAEDTMTGGDGNDILFGLRGIDRMQGESGDDYLLGGAETDVINDTLGNNVIRATNPSAGDITIINPRINTYLTNFLSPALQRYVTELDQEKNSLTIEGQFQLSFPG
ncbi:MAG: DUF4347 domain-containing protein [Leptolyngbya sp. Prado105]|nr:DUF4347 domain-containing protein [Leptolyngbya sp. Prado105]